MLARNAEALWDDGCPPPRVKNFQADIKLNEVTNTSWIVHMTCCTDCDTQRFDPLCYQQACVTPPCAQRASVCWELASFLYKYVGGSTEPEHAGPLGLNTPQGRAASALGAAVLVAVALCCGIRRARSARCRVEAYEGLAQVQGPS